MKFKEIRNLRLSVIRTLLKQKYTISNIINGELSYAELNCANLMQANFNGAILIGANFNYAHLADAHFNYSNLDGAKLIAAILIGANFNGANLVDVKFNYAHLNHANFNGANLSRAKLIGANLNHANLNGANLNDAELSCAELSHKFISITQMGSRNSITNIDIKNKFVWCGCWSGNIDDFKIRVEQTHKDNKYAKEYMELIKFCEKLHQIYYGEDKTIPNYSLK
jgi:uncharacterized protein YjbI with pentapeptide repeats